MSSDYLPNLAFMGKAGAGKSSAALALKQTYGYETFSFAGPLKDVAQTIWGEGARKNRDILQPLGQAVRAIDPDAWVNLLLADVSYWSNGPVAVDDLRFPNEYWRLKERGFTIVRVTASKWRRVDRLEANGKLQSPEQLMDTSETALDDYDADYTIENDGDPDDFGFQVIELLRQEQARVQS